MLQDFKFRGHDFEQSLMVRATRPTILLMSASMYFYCFLPMEEWAKPYFETLTRAQNDYLDVMTAADFNQ